MQAVHRVRRRIPGRTLLGLLLVPILPLVAAFLVPAEAVLVGIVAAVLWVVLLARGDITPRGTRRATFAIGAAAALAGVVWFLLLDWR